MPNYFKLPEESIQRQDHTNVDTLGSSQLLRKLSQQYNLLEKNRSGSATYYSLKEKFLKCINENSNTGELNSNTGELNSNTGELNSNTGELSSNTGELKISKELQITIDKLSPKACKNKI